jgi:putative ABC transport system substrate-binding protein
MNKYFLTIIILFFSLTGRAFGYEIVVLKSSTSKINQQIQDIFTDEIRKRILHRGLKSIQPYQVTYVVISRGDERDSINTIQNTQPDLILALGAQALKVALLIPDIPIVHLLVVNPEKILDKTRPVTGVSLSVSPRVQLHEMTSYFPEVRRIGLVYDPERSSKTIGQLKSLRSDLEFVALDTKDIAEVPELIHSLRGKVDLLWMLPDLTTTNQMTIQSYVLFSVRNKIPLLTFSQKLLKHGATIAITFNTDKMARQAATLAMDMLLHPVGAGQPSLVDPPVETIINDEMAAKLGISIAKRRAAGE